MSLWLKWHRNSSNTKNIHYLVISKNWQTMAAYFLHIVIVYRRKADVESAKVMKPFDMHGILLFVLDISYIFLSPMVFKTILQLEGIYYH